MASTSAPPEVRARVRVYWPVEQQWFEGTVDRISEQHGVQYFRVSYDDTDVQWHAANETWESLRISKRIAHDHLTSSANRGSTVVAKRIKNAPSLKRGQRISVYWQDEGKWFEGTVRDYDRCSRCHLVVYDDGDQRHEHLEDDPELQWSIRSRAHTGKSKISRGTDGALAVQMEQAVWACCDKCGKWRRLFDTAEEQPEKWQCTDHPNELTCHDPEDEMDVDEQWDGAIAEAAPTEASENAYSLRHSTPKLTPPAFANGDLVYVPFDDRQRHLGTVVDWHQRGATAIGRPLFTYSVLFTDGETAEDVGEDEMKPAGPVPSGVEEPVVVRMPTAEQLEKQLEKAPSQLEPLPTASIPRELMVNGAAHCGGDLCFPNLTLADPRLGCRMPVFMMAPGAVAGFSGAKLCHCTTEHHAERSGGCAAHVSFAVQTPALTLGLHKQPSKRAEVETELHAYGVTDSLSERWREAVWLPVWHACDAPSPETRLFHDESLMCALPWRRIVLYDAEKDQRLPLVFYDMEGGLDDDCAAFARGHFSFLHDQWEFKLDRHQHEANRSGCLHVDAKGAQWMEMLGIHSRQRNVSHPPEKSREKRGRQHLIANAQGDLDAYVVHFDHPSLFCDAGLRQLWNGISKRMHALLPLASGRMVQMLGEAGVRERLYSVAAIDAVSDDLLVNNVGVSAAYQSPPHFDVTDVGWTFAFSCKCGRCAERI